MSFFNAVYCECCKYNRQVNRKESGLEHCSAAKPKTTLTHDDLLLDIDSGDDNE